MASKLFAQIVVMTGQVLGKAVAEGYKQAIKNASMGLSRAAPKMTLPEAEKILEVRKAMPLKEIEKKFQTVFNANDPKKGGSFYVQSKVYRAWECLENELKETVTESSSSASSSSA
eukprot:GCRY01002515.1.p1 GENE.GCRY01002515.1~~GCRY01002515.1.p1  ORF type:complete len:116 (-),score=14.34 GCRY01002515.1:112-459(-)